MNVKSTDHLYHLPEAYRLEESFAEDIRRAVNILKKAGCGEIFLFGSLAGGDVRENSDIDLAIRGCPSGKFFHLLGRLLIELEHPVDLINLDWERGIARYLQEEGELLRVG